jgi:hypothetical protein
MSKNLYVIAHDEYMGIIPDIYKFQGSYRELLEFLNDIDDTNRDDPIDPDADEPEYIKDLTDEQLLDLFKKVNGDGQPYFLVYDVTNSERII